VLARCLSDALAMSPAAREAIGARGRGIVERTCSSTVVAAETVEVFREILATAVRAGAETRS
jgi:hypothetical protein